MIAMRLFLPVTGCEGLAGRVLALLATRCPPSYSGSQSWACSVGGCLHAERSLLEPGGPRVDKPN